MKPIPDLVARARALTAIENTLLVEAGAGSGKTSVMAGRVAVLFGKGVEPKNIAAITFTELAASELRLRIEKFTTALSLGDVPPDLTQAFPEGVPEAEKANLYRACQSFDQLACTTIHGFAQSLIKPYPAEAGIDPGADIVDPDEAELAFGERYDAWLKQRLSVDDADGLVAQLVLADEGGGLKLIEEVAQFLRKNRDARCAPAAWAEKTMADVIAAVKRFEDALAAVGFEEEDTGLRCRTLIALVDILNPGKLSAGAPDTAALIAALNFPRHTSCFTEKGTRRQLRNGTKWQDAAAKVGLKKADGKKTSDALVPLYDGCHNALETLLAAIAGELLSRLCAEMQGLLLEWRDYKRDAALLDFDDLLFTARDLLAGHPEVRRALSQRYRYVLVDEFQDTDPLQTEILWMICGEDCEGADGAPLKRPLRPGALFMVGDPKQAIYRFRGADVNAYLAARSAVPQDARLAITANFRSVEPILAFVNKRFERVLSEEAGQPGFAELSPVRPPNGDAPAVVALDVTLPQGASGVSAIRDAEAAALAELCCRLVGNLQVHDPETKELRPCRLGDIALLAPAGTELWRFEEVLEDRGIPVATQAGKGFFRRQEIHDLIALVRTLADPRDTLALGALLRGPLIGLTENELLDIMEGLPVDPDRPARLPTLTVGTNPEHIAHAVARKAIENLQALRRRIRITTPYALLADAMSDFHVRPHLRQRFRTGAERAVANVDLFLEFARAYDVRGLRAFSRDMTAKWEDDEDQAEGRPDAEEESVSLITVHAAKGLEWPVVIPINMTGKPFAGGVLMQDRPNSRFSIPVLGTEPSDYAAMKTMNALERDRERVRLWYVGVTRSRDLLVLPRHTELPKECWATLVDLDVGALPAVDPESFGPAGTRAARIEANEQTREIFAAEAGRIFAAREKIVWRQPSRSEVDGEGEKPDIRIDHSEPPGPAEVEKPVVVGSAQRGVILHKLMEEIINGEVGEHMSEIESRAALLKQHLGIEPTAEPQPVELAATVLKTLALPAIKALRPRMVAELPVFGSVAGADEEVLISGQVDVVALDDAGEIDVVVDWKSDVDPSAAAVDHYRQQIGDYRRLTGAKKALLVFMTAGQVVEILLRSR
ncbi:UvrD/REP helicase [Rhodopseudomonas palustris BisB5]|uniref:DNA 3'-5' helicase n=1 Tax=Rhodopseudomonas palustris (strain BisB5) TaxID=316057 RepID=Q13F62_RHOPS|nr:UvrD/REP helicase [Rhodopseudomonas palustris BisB5]